MNGRSKTRVGIRENEPEDTYQRVKDLTHTGVGTNPLRIRRNLSNFSSEISSSEGTQGSTLLYVDIGTKLRILFRDKMND